MSNVRVPVCKIAFAVSLLSSLTFAAHAAGKLPKKTTPASKEQPSLVKASGDESAADASGDSLKFKTDAPVPNTDSRPTMTFTDPGDAPLGQRPPDYADTLPDDEPYRAYLGYPKHRFDVNLELMNLSSKWNYKGQDFNFSNSPVAVGAYYNLIFTPKWNLAFDYRHYAMSIDDAQIRPYNIHSSSANYDDYFLKLRRCFIGKASFYRQLCPGIDVGMDSYPILRFKGSSDLYLDRVQDITVGLNLHYLQPFSDDFLLNLGIAYNYGTGLGNSGALTTKNDDSWVGDIGVEWNHGHHGVQVAGVLKARDAKLQGQVGNNTDTWTTESTEVGLKAGYSYTFN